MSKSKPGKDGDLSNGSHAGSQLPRKGRANIHGRTKYKISDLLFEMPGGLPLKKGWEEIPEVGLEME